MLKHVTTKWYVLSIQYVVRLAANGQTAWLSCVLAHLRWGMQSWLPYTILQQGPDQQSLASGKWDLSSSLQYFYGRAPNIACSSELMRA